MPDMSNMNMPSECHSSRWMLVTDKPATGVGAAAWSRCYVRRCTFSTPDDAGIHGASRKRDSGQEGKKRSNGLAGYFPGSSTVVLLPMLDKLVINMGFMFCVFKLWCNLYS
jgi:hypothetical protein